VNDKAVIAVAKQKVPEWNALLVIVNSTIYGGTGGTVGTCSLGTDAEQISIHEIGHLFGLADEYSYLARCEDASGNPLETDHSNHRTATEPVEPNVAVSDDYSRMARQRRRRR
jgi:hypothetical protein